MLSANYMLVFLGGGVGAMSRLFVSGAVAKHVGTGFPWGTLAVNVIGALMIGFIIELLALKFSMSPALRYLIVTGFLGGFTTFSAFSLETYAMIEKGDYVSCAAYILLSIFGTIAAVWLASATIKMVL